MNVLHLYLYVNHFSASFAVTVSYIYGNMNNDANNYALSVFRDNPDFAARLKEQTELVKKSHKNLREAAVQLSSKYNKEVVEGTRKVQILLENGQSRGLTEEQIFAGQCFHPTVRSPILNMIYFLMREHPDAHKINFNRLAEDIDRDPDILLKEQNTKYGSEYHDERDEKTADHAPEMEEFVYGEMTMATYQTIKKLKRLSLSPNEAEAFAAYRKCVEMCKKYNLEFDKVKI